MAATSPLAAFVRTGLPRLIEGGGGLRWVRAPTVWEALATLALSESALAATGADAANGSDDTLLFEQILTPWLGARLAEYVCRSRADLHDRAELLQHLLGEGLPAGAKQTDGAEQTSEERDAAKQGRSIEQIRWDLVVLDVCETFGWGIESVLAMPWPRFMLVASRLDAVQARQQLRQAYVAVLPHVKDSPEMIESIQRRASAPDASTAEVDAELEELEARVGRAWSRAHWGPPPRRAAAMEEYLGLEKELAGLKKQRGH